MNIQVGDVVFDRFLYDEDADVLYMSVGDAKAASTTVATPDGHAVRYDASGAVIGVTVVNAKWLVERDGGIRIVASRTVNADEFADLISAA